MSTEFDLQRGPCRHRSTALGGYRPRGFCVLCIVRPHTHSTPDSPIAPESDSDAQRVLMFLDRARRSKGAHGGGSDDRELERIFVVLEVNGAAQGMGVDTDSVSSGG